MVNGVGVVTAAGVTDDGVAGVGTAAVASHRCWSCPSVEAVLGIEVVIELELSF